MATIQLPYGIASISGKIGNVVFYHQNGKQYARRLNKRTTSPESFSQECRAILEPLSGVLNPNKRGSHPPATPKGINAER